MLDSIITPQTLTAMTDELTKIAASRQAKELAKGTISYSDLDPSIPSWMPTGQAVAPSLKRRIRSKQTAAAEVAPELLQRRRELAGRSVDQVLRSGSGAGLDSAASKVRISEGMLPGMGPGTTFDGRVHSDTGAGQFARGLISKNPITQVRAVAGTSNPSLLPRAKPVDKTLNRAILQHEIGEAVGLKGGQFAGEGLGKIQPHATHVGVEPILREQLYAMGDSEAIKMMGKMRTLHPDDTFVQKAIRQVGGTPDSPIPIGGKKHKALERILARQADVGLHETTGQRARLVAEAIGKDTHFHGTPGASNTGLDRLKKTFTQARHDPNLRMRLGLGAAGLAGVGLAGYGAKRFWDKHQASKKQ